MTAPPADVLIASLEPCITGRALLSPSARASEANPAAMTAKTNPYTLWFARAYPRKMAAPKKGALGIEPGEPPQIAGGHSW